MISTLLHIVPASKRGRLLTHLLLTIGSVCLRAVAAVALVPLVAALFSPEPATAWPWLGALALATVIGWVLDATAARIGFDLGFSMLATAQHAVADKLEQVRLDWFDAANTTTARQAIAATGPTVVGIMIYLVTPLVASLALPVAIAAALLPISWPLALAALAGAPVLLLAFWGATRFGRGADRIAEESNAALTERILEFARTQQALRAARRAEVDRSHVGAALAAQHGAGMKLLARQVPGQILFGLATQLSLVILAGTTTVLTLRGELAVPEAIALVTVVVRYLEPFTTLAELSAGLEGARLTLGRIGQVLAAPDEVHGAVVRDRGSAPTLELRGVTFGHVPGEPVLEGFDLRIEAGTTTAVVGPSGSGKSTLLALMAGLHEPEAGAVVVDGVPVPELTAQARRDLVSVVFQQPYLFDGSIRDNVLTGHPGATDDELAAAMALARVDEITRRLPDGLATPVGEGGRALSGGERQRVSIARALVKPAGLLLVDEATSALDTENEAALVSALGEDAHPRTRVVVAHRLSSIAQADRVVFLDDGRILEDGTIEELLAAGGRFAEFWSRQEAGASWRITT